ncbi:hypothetical protein [Laspinema olomoucense]|uniref:hypothetical protein n=1 Tax=Laspinema olomoucense TaxID=3231600 RepID=UPI0021BB38BC|nr:hypothetical protein [Laspinema sp. D3d]MCT7975258.1 hypothetical protein [Laspinema sp. D3d]
MLTVISEAMAMGPSLSSGDRRQLSESSRAIGLVQENKCQYRQLSSIEAIGYGEITITD